MFAAMVTTDAANKAAGTDASRLGYIVSTADASGTNVAVAGRVFGRLGQGTDSYPGASAWLYGDKPATNTPTMMVSFFPLVDADAGMTATANEVTASAVTAPWSGLDAWIAPGQPAAAAAPMSTGASYLSAGIASALIIASLY